MDENPLLIPGKWRKVAYGGMQPGFDVNHTDDSFLEEMVTNANVVTRDLFKVVLDSISISQYICIVSRVILVWSCTLESTITYNSLLLLDVILLGSGFLVLVCDASRVFIGIDGSSFDISLQTARIPFRYVAGFAAFHHIYMPILANQDTEIQVRD